MTFKLIVFWVFGGLLITASAWILGHLEAAQGAYPMGYAITAFIAFIMILIGGLAWINVASASSKH
jgi:hypothetical protein